MTDNSQEATAWTWAAMEPEPTEQERQLYDRFAAELLIDNDPTRAASRCGFQAGFAEEYGRRFVRISYVQRRIAEMRRGNVDTAADNEYDKASIINTLRRVMMDDYQRGTARVAAARSLAELRGFTLAAKAPADASIRGGVVLMPGIAKIDDWEAQAEASQRKLAEESRVD